MVKNLLAKLPGLPADETTSVGFFLDWSVLAATAAARRDLDAKIVRTASAHNVTVTSRDAQYGSRGKRYYELSGAASDLVAVVGKVDERLSYPSRLSISLAGPTHNMLVLHQYVEKRAREIGVSVDAQGGADWDSTHLIFGIRGPLGEVAPFGAEVRGLYAHFMGAKAPEVQAPRRLVQSLHGKQHPGQEAGPTLS